MIRDTPGWTCCRVAECGRPVGTADRSADAAGPAPAAHADVVHELPPGLPGRVTADLLALTLEVWQPHYADPLTVEDAAAMLTGVRRLLSVLMGTSRHS